VCVCLCVCVCSLCVWTRERTKPQVSADEKVKRAFYLAQCYADQVRSWVWPEVISVFKDVSLYLYFLSLPQDFLSTVLDVLTPEDVRVLAAGEDELTRLGQFQRIFPSPASSRYLRFFECPRYLNVLLDQWERKFCSSRPKGAPSGPEGELQGSDWVCLLIQVFWLLQVSLCWPLSVRRPSTWGPATRSTWWVLIIALKESWLSTSFHKYFIYWSVVCVCVSP